MRVLVTGSAGHLGEALVRTLEKMKYEVIGLDILQSPFTTHVGSITDRACVRRCLSGVQVVLHTATLHKPHIVTHDPQSFVDTNVTGTLTLLQEAVAAGVECFVFTSTTSVFGDALVPPAGTPAAWVTEDVTPVPKNIYGVTKAAAEDLCQVFHMNVRLSAGAGPIYKEGSRQYRKWKLLLSRLERLSRTALASLAKRAESDRQT
jgi:UDP-glucose 4-epimerase